MKKDWAMLLESKCPLCGVNLSEPNELTGVRYCEFCSFSISGDRLEEIAHKKLGRKWGSSHSG